MLDATTNFLQNLHPDVIFSSILHPGLENTYQLFMRRTQLIYLKYIPSLKKSNLEQNSID